MIKILAPCLGFKDKDKCLSQFKIETPLRNAQIYLSSSGKTRWSKEQMALFADFIKRCVVHFAPYAIACYDTILARFIKIMVPQTGTMTISTTGCVWFLGFRRQEDIEAWREHIENMHANFFGSL